MAVSNVKDLGVVKTDQPIDFVALKKSSKQKKLHKATKKEKALILKNLKKQLDEAVKNREFEKAAMIRDQILQLEGKENEE